MKDVVYGAIWFIAILVIIVAIVSCIFVTKPKWMNKLKRKGCGCKGNESTKSVTFASEPTKARETFLVTPNKATVNENGSIISNGILTNQMSRVPVDELTNRVNSNGYVAEGAISPGIGMGNGFQTAYDNQKNIIDIGNKAMGGYETKEQLKQITQQITMTNNNANNNLFTRAGDKPTKLILEPNGVRCIIDEKYMVERDKNHQIASVGTVIPTQGFDVNVDRMGEELLDTHFSAISCNKTRTRIPTAAGAVVMNNGQTESVNTAALQSGVGVVGDNVVFTDVGGDSKTIKATVDPATPQATENFRKYIRNSGVY